MNANRVFELNGDFSKSPLIEVARRLDKLFSEHSIAYAIIGGLAVARNGAVRTTVDVDILTSHDGWNTIRRMAPAALQTATDSAIDTGTGVEIDVFFDGDEWDMVIPLEKAETINEYDEELGAWFISLLHLLELKTAVYLKKLSEDGIEIAAKDLADVVALIENNIEAVDEKFVERVRIEVRDELTRIFQKVQSRFT